MRPQENQRRRPGLPEYSPRHLSPETCLRLFPIATVTNGNGKRQYSQDSQDSSAPSEDEVAPKSAPRPIKRSKTNQGNDRVETRYKDISEGPKDSEHAMPPQPAPRPFERSKPNQDGNTGHNGSQPKGEFGLYFSNIEEVNANNVVAFQPPSDTTLPKSDEDRQALVKRLVDAINYVDPALTDKTKVPPKSFQNRWVKRAYYTPVQIEKAAWEVLNETEGLYTRGWTREIYDSGLMSSIRATIDWKFKQRVDEIVSLLRVAKNVCESLLKGEKLWSIIGIPRTLKSSSETNKKQNARKQVRIDLGKKAEPSNSGKPQNVSTTAPTRGTAQSHSAVASEALPDSAALTITPAQALNTLQDGSEEEGQCNLPPSPVSSSQPVRVYIRDPTPDCPDSHHQITPMPPKNQEPEGRQPDISEAMCAEGLTQDGNHQNEQEARLFENNCSVPETSDREATLSDAGTSENVHNATNVDKSSPHYGIHGSMSSGEHAAVTSEAANTSSTPDEMHPFSAYNENDGPTFGQPSEVQSFTEAEYQLSHSFLADLDHILTQEIDRMDAERSPQPARSIETDGVVYQAAQNFGTGERISGPRRFYSSPCPQKQAPSRRL